MNENKMKSLKSCNKSSKRWIMRKLMDEKVDWWESQLKRKLIDEKVDWSEMNLDDSWWVFELILG